MADITVWRCRLTSALDLSVSGSHRTMAGSPKCLSKGDVIVIQVGTPHWGKEVPQSITLYAVNLMKQ
jgi:hypothetical protein